MILVVRSFFHRCRGKRKKDNYSGKSASNGATLEPPS
jgi:hypothetical protein